VQPVPVSSVRQRPPAAPCRGDAGDDRLEVDCIEAGVFSKAVVERVDAVNSTCSGYFFRSLTKLAMSRGFVNQTMCPPSRSHMNAIEVSAKMWLERSAPTTTCVLLRLGDELPQPGVCLQRVRDHVAVGSVPRLSTRRSCRPVVLQERDVLERQRNLLEVDPLPCSSTSLKACASTSM